MKAKICAAVAVLLPLVGAGAAQATSIVLDTSQDFGGDAGIYGTLDETFTLPVGFTNAVLNITSFQADDRAVLQLNGTNVSNTGIFNNDPTPPPSAVGEFFFLADGSDDAPFTFDYSNESTVFAAITGPFVVGLNTLHFIINNTFNGINGGPVGDNPMNINFEGSVTFDTAVTPLPAALPLFAGGLGALGLFGWRRKRKAIAA